MTAALTQSIHDHAAALGFAHCGICEAQPSDYDDHFHQWLSDEKHGDMAWLANHADLRIDPTELVPNAKSIIVVADRIPKGVLDENMPAAHRGRVARYAHVTDYHKVIKKRLFKLVNILQTEFPKAEFKACVDTVPIFEREHGMRAGLGWTGKHTLLIHRESGSHLLLGEIVTTLALSPSEPETDHCGTCTRCIEACPTQCISSYSVDASRCISYLTIEKRSSIEPEFFEAIDDWLYGCDICQDVCPHTIKAENERPTPLESAPHAGYELRATALDITQVLRWTEADRREAFIKSAMKRAKLDQMKRNALIVAGNHYHKSGDPALLELIQQHAAETDPPASAIIRETAQAVLAWIECKAD